jgi:hypothetical protein
MCWPAPKRDAMVDDHRRSQALEPGPDRCLHPPVETLATIFCRRCKVFKKDGVLYDEEDLSNESLVRFIFPVERLPGLTMNPILFLDIDGVLNSDAYYRRGAYDRDQRRFPQQFRGPVDHKAVAIVNKILRQSGAAVVISSAWRCDMPLKKIAEILGSRGFKGRIVGATPRAARNCNSPDNRGRQIAAWLRLHPQVEHLAIVDDTSDMAPLDRWLVQINPERGLLDRHIPYILETMRHKLRRAS